MRVSQNLIFVPVFALVLLTLFVLLALWRARTKWLMVTKTPAQDLALSSDKITSELAQKLANNYKNLFELPVLFYVACVFAYTARLVDGWMLGLAVLFVITRYAHTIVHVGKNWVLGRFYAALASCVVVGAMWVLLMWRVAAAGF